MGYLALPGTLQAGQGLSLPCWETVGSAMAIEMVALVQYCSPWTVRPVASRLPRHSHWGTLCYTDARQGHRQTSLSLSRAI